MEKRIFYEMAKFIEIPVVITLLFSVLSRRNHYVRPRPQRFFDDPSQHHLIGVTGYHYGVGQFNADPVYLQRKLNITLVKDNVSALQALLKGRGEVAILNVSYLNQYLLANPDTADQLLISQKWDQQYQHRAILHPEAPITPAQLEQWLAVLQQKGELDRLWTKYGVQQHATP